MFAFRKYRRRRGFTLVEVAISSVIAAMVGLAVVALQIISGNVIKDVYGQTRTRSSRFIAIDQLRYRLYNGMIGSVDITNDGHRLEFNDPNLGTVTSAFFFVEDTNTLFYDEDIDDADPAVEMVEGPIDITFEVDPTGALVTLNVKSSSEMRYGDVDVQDGETTVYMRNF